MNSTPAPQRTPLRRISQGSLFRLSRSGAFPDAPHGLAFLEPAMSELVDEAESLNTNVSGLKNLGDALTTFNESFASLLYVMNMNALTTDWPQAPADASFALAARRAKEDAEAALAAMEAARSVPLPPSPDVSAVDKTALTADNTEIMNETYNSAHTAASTTSSKAAPTATKGILKKKKVLSAKEKKERGILADKVVSHLPLEFRGSDPNLRRHIEMVIEKFLDRPDRGLAITEMIKAPDLTQARANKCLIALVNRKIVQKDNSTGQVLYHWHGLPA
ncbi:hypothetical protein CERSUDRAFT_113930 [Gelatoporia subvermispora B]|uniref:DASH complex subunit DAM1 n=1 Tax=Ceriporiopsis subvermispora (strain B) TaxID=914234 RepID=M2REL9_CERS8|nr:hypothetical protein CERSUDRAFT_113930 [Gelatoporia subvermispora B]